MISSRWLSTLIIAGLLGALYVAYAIVVGPMLGAPNRYGASGQPHAPSNSGSGQSSRESATSPGVSSGADAKQRTAAEHLPHKPWAQQSKYTLRSNDNTLFTNELEHVGTGDEIRFSPFAMVSMVQRDGKLQTTTVTCDSALLKFAQAFDIRNPNPGRIIGGALEGDVTIQSGAELRLQGKAFYFSESALRLWSDLDVDFAFGEHRGQAGKLQAELLPLESAQDKTLPAIMGIRSLRLSKNVKTRFVLQQGGKPFPIAVKTPGSLEYIVDSKTATFETDRPGYDKVEAYRAIGERPDLWMRCETLRVQLGPKLSIPNEPPKQKAKLANGYQEFETDLEFVRLEATGQKLTLVSEPHGFRGVGQKLTYDVQTRNLVLTHSSKLSLVAKDGTLEVPSLAVFFGPSDQLERVVCEGPGGMKNIDPVSGKVLFSADWKTRLTKSAPSDEILDVIELVGGASCRQPIEQLGLAANRIQLWVDRVQTNVSLDGGAKPPGTPAETGDLASSGLQMQPRRMLAEGQVSLISPQFDADTEHLDVRFEELGGQPAVLQPDLSFTQPLRSPILFASQKPLIVRSGVAIPPSSTCSQDTYPVQAFASVADNASSRLKNLPAKQPYRFHMRADEIVVQMLPVAPDASSGNTAATAAKSQSPPKQSRPKYDLSELWATGHFDMKQLPAGRLPGPDDMLADGTSERYTAATPISYTTQSDLAVAGPHRFHASGEQLHLQNFPSAHSTATGTNIPSGESGLLSGGLGGGNSQIVKISGAPAVLLDGLMRLEGPQVNLDRIENLAWVDGPGKLELPIPQGLDGKPLPKPEILEVIWKHGMTFDGLTAGFEGAVGASFRMEQEDSQVLNRMDCQTLNVTLSEKVFFGDEGQASQPAALKSILCRDGVKFESYEQKRGKLVSVRRGEMWEFGLNHVSGKTSAQGPGKLQVWQRKVAPGETGLADPQQANRPRRVDGGDWEYRQVKFGGHMQGNTIQQTATFQNRVEALFGPVAKPADTLDADELPKGSGWMRCDLLQLNYVAKNPQATPKPSAPSGTLASNKTPSISPMPADGFIELVGSGNATLEGSGFNGRADQISFDQSKNLYVLRSNGTRQASIWRRNQSGAHAQRMEFNPESKSLKLDRTTGGEATE